jgi:hypothetical protein
VFAGLPGMGVGTLFYVLIALFMPVYECVRLIRGDSSLARWRVVAVQFSFAIGIIASITIAGRMLEIILGTLSPGSVGVAALITAVFVAKAPGSFWASPVTASFLLLIAILCSVEALRWLIAFAAPRQHGDEDSGTVSPTATFSDEAVNS